MTVIELIIMAVLVWLFIGGTLFLATEMLVKYHGFQLQDTGSMIRMALTFGPFFLYITVKTMQAIRTFDEYMDDKDDEQDN